MIIGHKYNTEAMDFALIYRVVGEHSKGVEAEPRGLVERLEKQM
jgi:hypothetical protein